MHKLRFVTAMILVSIAVTVNAADSEGTFRAPEEMTTSNWNGLIDQIPSHAPDKVLGEVREMHSNFLSRQAELQKIVVDSKMKPKDVAITILVPGGLAYAAHKKLKQKRAKTELKSVAIQLSELRKDMLMLQLASERTVAMLYVP